MIRKTMYMGPEYAEKKCKLLEQAIHQVYDGKVHDVCLHPLHRAVLDMVNKKFVDKVYGVLVKAMTLKLQEIATSVEVYQGTSFLIELHRKWLEHRENDRTIMYIYAYLDRGVCTPTSGKTPVDELGRNLWRDNIIRSSNVNMKLKDTLLEIVHKERCGEAIDTGLMRNITKMLMDLGPSVYRQDFEKHFLNASARFYQQLSQEFIRTCDCGGYLKETEKRLSEETERVSKYLDVQSQMRITSVVKREMIETRMTELVHMKNSGLVDMILGNKYEEMGMMYKFIGRVPNGPTLIRDVMTCHFYEIGKQLVIDPEMLKDPFSFVEHLLGESEKHDKIMELAFDYDKGLHRAIRSSFMSGVRFNRRVAQDISLFLNEKLNKRQTENLEIWLQKVMNLFRDLDDKDVFGSHYKKHLAKRLLSYETKYDEDAERSIIRKLKAECGSQYTSSMEDMLTDLKASQVYMDEFGRSRHRLRNGPKLSVHVLKHASWPDMSATMCTLPPEILRLHSSFLKFYAEKHNGRKLTWLVPSMSSAILDATWSSGLKTRELHVTAYQMCVLMLFNDRDEMTYKEIEQEVGIPPSDLKLCLESLTLSGQNVLKKASHDTFIYNQEFSSECGKLKLRVVVGEREPEVERGESKQLEAYRRQIVEAAIVRIMKTRKELSHINLVSEVIGKVQTKFKPDPSVIKKATEDLCRREFLERSKNDPNLWQFIP